MVGPIMSGRGAERRSGTAASMVTRRGAGRAADGRGGSHDPAQRGGSARCDRGLATPRGFSAGPQVAEQRLPAASPTRAARRDRSGAPDAAPVPHRRGEKRGGERGRKGGAGGASAACCEEARPERGRGRREAAGACRGPRGGGVGLVAGSNGRAASGRCSRGSGGGRREPFASSPAQEAWESLPPAAAAAGSRPQRARRRAVPGKARGARLMLGPRPCASWVGADEPVAALCRYLKLLPTSACRWDFPFPRRGNGSWEEMFFGGVAVGKLMCLLCIRVVI